MKVGIITYHRAHNYGAVLQCYALQTVLATMGHDVYVVDYRQSFIERLYNPSKRDLILRHKTNPRALLGLIRVFISLHNKKRRFEKFCTKYLNLSQPCSSEDIPSFDVYIIGSDQMWSIDCAGGRIDPVYFGLFKRPYNSKLVGFSISSNKYSVERLGADINFYLSRFDHISFREQFVTDSILHSTGKAFTVTLDPTLCADAELWDKVINEKWEKRKYVAVYHVLLRSSADVYKKIISQAERIAKTHGWDVIDLSSGIYDVQDFVSVIKYAQCVVTSSFHATVFSVIFSRPLFSIRLHDGNDSRYENLLDSLGMTDALVDLDFSSDNPFRLDSVIIQRKLTELREPSLKFLRDSIV